MKKRSNPSRLLRFSCIELGSILSSDEDIRYNSKNTKDSYFKWISIEPGVTYTISFDYKVTAAGSGKIKLVDNNISLPVEFGSVSFSSKTNDWKTYSITFNPNNVHTQIGFVIYDGGGAAMIDDVRVFKASVGVASEPAEEISASLKPVNTATSTTDPETASPTVGNGLAFLVKLQASGFNIREDHTLDYTSAEVNAFGTGEMFNIKEMGAIMCNSASGASADYMVRANVNSKNTLDIPAKKGISAENGAVEFAVRIINIPDTHLESTIYMRPYYVFEYNGEDVIVYGDISQRCFKEDPKVNDGQLNWD